MASVIRTKQTDRELAAGVALLWVLFTAFFWFGYWLSGRVHETSSASTVPKSRGVEPDSPRRRPERSPPHEADREAVKQRQPARL